jgi:peroxiredoxin Q/BCP
MQLKKGDKAPDFVLQDQNGKTVRLSDYRGRSVLLFFYPKAGTSGCTKQAESVRDARTHLHDRLNIQAIGISPDAEQAQKKFDDKNHFGFPLLADVAHKVAEEYGVWQEKSLYGKKTWGIVRSAFLVDEHGAVSGARYKIKPEETVPWALEMAVVKATA